MLAGTASPSCGCQPAPSSWATLNCVAAASLAVDKFGRATPTAAVGPGRSPPRRQRRAPDALTCEHLGPDEGDRCGEPRFHIRRPGATVWLLLQGSVVTCATNTPR